MRHSDDKGIAVIGAGSWGTALALVLARNGMRVSLWARNTEHVARMEIARENPDYLPGHAFPASLQPERSLETITTSFSRFLIVVPSRAYRATLKMLIESGMKDDSLVAWGTKGFDSRNTALLSDVAREEIGSSTHLAVVTGPSFAREVAAGLPTALAVAGSSPFASGDIATCLRNERMRVYINEDMTGVQIGGAVKNVIAVATGISDGMGLGANARAALITRGLAEINRLGVLLGADPGTLMGLAGLGDLVLTCTDDQSRNRRLGLGLGRGESLSDIVSNIGQEVESLVTARELHQLANKLRLEMPIAEQVYNVLYNDVSAQASVETLLRRDPAKE